MSNLHEFSGTITYETNIGLENYDFAYSLILAPDADENLLEPAAKAIAQFLVLEQIEKNPKSRIYHDN